MAEAFNSLRPFGFNVMSQNKQSQGNVPNKTIEKAMDSLWGPVLNYLEKNEDVFSGSVAEAINKANIQTMRLGVTMNGDEPLRNLDTKI